MKHLIYFRGGQKSEEIYFSGQLHTFGVGGVISDLLALNISHINRCNEAIKKDLLLPILDRQRPVYDLRYLPEYISKMELTAFFQDLFLWQPFNIMQVSAAAEQEEHSFTAQEVKLIQANLPPTHTQAQLNKLKSLTNASLNIFSDLIKNKYKLRNNPFNPLDSPDAEASILHCLEFYINNWDSLILFLNRLPMNLTDFLQPNSFHASAKTDLIYAGLQTGEIPTIDYKAIFSSKPNTKYTVIRTATRIHDIVALELSLMEKNYQHFEKCRLCGRYYVPFSNRAVYCRNPNPEYENRPCSAVGPALFHRNNHKDDVMYQKLTRAKKTYAKWAHDNGEDNGTEIGNEIKVNRIAWKKAAEAAFENYKSGIFSKDELELLLKLPSLSERSPLLREQKELDRLLF